MQPARPIKIHNGIRKVDSAYAPASAIFTNHATALPVLHPTAPPADCSEDSESKKVDDYDEEEIVVQPTNHYQDAISQYQASVEPEICLDPINDNTGPSQSSGRALQELQAVMAKYEVPVGLLSKLLQVKDYQVIEIIVDDSGSMNAQTDVNDPQTHRPMSRWTEAKTRILQMIELLVHVVTPVIYIRFLNRPNVLELRRLPEDVSPDIFFARCAGVLEENFAQYPSGTTPALERIQESMTRYEGQWVLRYFLGDGVPNGGDFACREIERLLMHRVNPERNPFTFMSCTNVDSDVEWMKECEEKAKFCAEFDDYHDEAREVLKDQGKAFPYSFGLHLVAQIVAAFCPNDLDAMDESVPFTKETLESLLGYIATEPEYKYYFDNFILAQNALARMERNNYAKSRFLSQLPSLYPKFRSQGLAIDIPEVAEYREALRSLQNQSNFNQPPQHHRPYHAGGGGQQYRSNAPVGPMADDPCCIIQ